MSCHPSHSGEALCSGIVHFSSSSKGTTFLKKYIHYTTQRVRQALSLWTRLLALIWQTHPWYVSWILLITLALGLLPALQIQVTTQIIQNASLAAEQGQAPSLVRLALL